MSSGDYENKFQHCEGPCVVTIAVDEGNYLRTLGESTPSGSEDTVTNWVSQIAKGDAIKVTGDLLAAKAAAADQRIN